MIIDSLESYNEVIQKEEVILFYFSHDECNVCKVLKPKIIELINQEFPKIRFEYINIKSLPEIAAQNSVFTVPTILAYFDGKEFLRKSRNFGLNELHDAILKPYNLMFD